MSYGLCYSLDDQKLCNGIVSLLSLMLLFCRQKYVAGILLLASGSAVIPPKTKSKCCNSL